MKKFKYALVVATMLLSGQTLASPISIGPYVFDSDASATAANFTGNVFENVSGAITDNSISTYIKGRSNDATVNLNFDNIALSNQIGNDLALFFLTANSTVSLEINDINSGPLSASQLFVNPNDPFTDIGEKYIVTNILLPNGSLTTADFSVIFVDLDNFGLNINETLSDININLGNNVSLLTHAIGMHDEVVTAVPLPAPFLLLLSGLTGLGLISRRR